MQFTDSLHPRAPLAAIAALCFTASAAMAQTGKETGIDASGDYRQEVQACQSGRTPQDKATCLKEARNAQADRRRGKLADAGPADYRANALARCEPFKGDDRLACQDRVMGRGQVSGSVAGGGLLREIETVVLPEEAPAAGEPGAPRLTLPADPMPMR